jgi:anthranilate synthase/aminodeoxychorismate synthase-like glutamine amidotransferase
VLLLIDNYDSFTYNLFQYLWELGQEVEVRRNDQVTLEGIESMGPRAIVLSPGPGGPAQAGVCSEVVREWGGRVPILGVCLGHQCIAYAYGGVVGRAGELMHGKVSMVHHDGRGIFAGLESPFPAVRYHSLAVRREGLPDCLEVSAWTEGGVIMGVRHRRYPIVGVQFHPESVMTRLGKELLRNFLTLV